MSTRKAVSKGTRFDIFRRDSFVCHYCGRQPPEVVLEIDHITPIAKGGDNDQMNLITSCRDCNAGKSAKLLDNPQRPDADLAWLEIQQETAELRGYQAAKEERDAVMIEIVESLQATWFDYSRLDWCPANHEIRKMLARHDPERIEQAIKNVALKMAGGYLNPHSNDWLPYIWGTLKNMADESER